MAAVNVTNVQVLDNPAKFLSPFKFEITFECLQPLADDLEWKFVYVGSAETQDHDQTLEEVLVGPVPVGVNRFIFQSPPPNPETIPQEHILGVTIVMLTCSYKENEFVRVGYYVNNSNLDDEGVDENMTGDSLQEPQHEIMEVQAPKTPVDFDRVQRNILADKPRVTRFPIDWS